MRIVSAAQTTMEADEYFQAYDALAQDENKTRITLRLGDTCGITQIIWSSFDYMTGPALRFVWDVAPSSDPLSSSGGDETVTGSIADEESLDSSMTNSSIQFEDIDDAMQGDLSIVEEAAAAEFSMSHFLDDYMAESRVSDRSSTLIGSDLMSDSFASSSKNRQLDESTDSFESLRAAEAAGGRQTEQRKAPSSSGTDTASSPNENHFVMGTPIDALNMAALLIREYGGQEKTLKDEQDEIAAAEEPNCTVTTGEVRNEEKADDEEEESTMVENAEVMTSGYYGSDRMIESDLMSPVDAPGVSFGGVARPSTETSPVREESSTRVSYLDKSWSPPEVEPGYQEVLSSRLLSSSFSSALPPSERGPSSSSPDPLLDDVTLDTQDDTPSDEQFIAKFVLAEQICSTPLTSNPLLHKLTVVPSRALVVGSFLFSRGEGRATDRHDMHALSFVMSDKRCNWYMERLPTLELMLSDIVPRMKASLFAEDAYDTFVRLTSEWTRLLQVYGALERFPLVSPANPIKAKRTLLVQRPPVHSLLLSRAITGCLQAQGNCIVIGSNQILVSKLLNTLVLLLPPELRWCCLRAYRATPYSPYIRIQTIRRVDVPRVLSAAAHSHWPVCVIDADRFQVAISPPFPRHSTLKRNSAISEINSILGKTSGAGNKAVRKELTSVRCADPVSTWLRRLDELPREESARLGFVDQLTLYLENCAKAFIAYVRDASEPSHSEKRNASRSARFSLSAARRALDLQSDSWFLAVLARAEQLEPEITDFIYM